jgi:glutamate N-acetyltransferase/amino-acid N-acetyltransferase
MAVGTTIFPEMHAVAGISLGTSCASIKQHESDDLLVVAMPEDCACAAVFTRNAFCAAPVVIAKKHLAQAPRWLVVNSGNANAGTGSKGLEAAKQTCAALAQLTGTDAEQVLPFSTGVIGELLPVDKITAALPVAVHNLAEDNWLKAAQAIMTTDTFAKGVSRQVALADGVITITGISKGSGMIAPNMATMLAFIATDAPIAAELLQHCLHNAVDQSFNLITVDGDTSTNDACVLMASGRAQVAEIVHDHESYQQFSLALDEVCKELAELIIRDGEGATKLIRIEVNQALDNAEAVRVGKTIANSPLVKTAFFASDPNWGRILAAVGRSEIEDIDLSKVMIYLGDVCIVRNGERDLAYTEESGQQIMNQQEISITVSLGRGDAVQQITTCDFSYNYVRINAEYRT